MKIFQRIPPVKSTQIIIYVIALTFKIYIQRDAPTMHNNDKDFRVFSLVREENEKSGTCGRSFSSFSFFSAIDLLDRKTNVIVSIGERQQLQ